MTSSLHEWVKVKTVQHIGHLGGFRVLEIGSLNINGTVRDIFSHAKEYIGIDMQSGKDVDLVLNSHDIPYKFPPHGFDVVVCLETLEHDDTFWLTLTNIHYVLKPGGFFFLSTPTINFAYHAYPKDYYRFTKDAYEDVLLKNYKILALDDLISDAGQPLIAGLGKKHG